VTPDTVVPREDDSQSWNRFSYVNNNPIAYKDPTGHILETAWDIASLAMSVGGLVEAVEEGDTTDIVIAAASVAVDTAAVLLPCVPGGAGAAIKATKAVGKKVAKEITEQTIKKGLKEGSEKFVKEGSEKLAKSASKKGGKKGTESGLAAKKTRNPYGSKGKPDHQNTVKELSDKAASEYSDISKYKIHENKSIKKFSGINRKPDVWVENFETQKIEKVYEAARTNKSGYVSREMKKMKEYEDAGIDHYFKAVK
jgi:hypothetical protein